MADNDIEGTSAGHLYGIMENLEDVESDVQADVNNSPQYYSFD